MTNNLTSTLGKFLFIVLFTCISIFSKAQMSYRLLSGFGTALADINDSGQAIMNSATFDYQSNTITPMDTDVVQLNAINNNGDLVGMMPILISGQTLYQPAYKHNGTWFPIGYFPTAGVDAAASVYQISENGNFVTGQMSPNCCDFQAFLYNVATDSLERIANPANEYGAGYCVNDSGIIGGWYDPQPAGTLRVPAMMTTGSNISNIPPGPLPTLGGQVSAINNSNVMVGDIDNAPFIYDLNTNTFTTFPVPPIYQLATFTSISENGIAVGYNQIFDFGTLIRDAIIYHPSLGPQPVLIKDLLAAHNLYVPTFDSLLGTAIAISPDGNYVCGWENGPFVFSTGWAIHFNDSLLPTGINEINASDWQVYPNPARDFVTITAKENIQAVRVFNSLMQQQSSYSVNSKSTKVNLTGMLPGIYFVELTTVRGLKVIKVLRE